MEPMTDSATAFPPPSDLPPAPAWLDDIEGDRALAWVAERNAAALAAVAWVSSPCGITSALGARYRWLFAQYANPKSAMAHADEMTTQRVNSLS